MFPPDLENNTLSVDLYAPRAEAIIYALPALWHFPVPDVSPRLNKGTAEMAPHFFLPLVCRPMIRRLFSSTSSQQCDAVFWGRFR